MAHTPVANKKSAAKPSRYKAFRLSKRLEHPYIEDVPKFRSLVAETVRLLKRNWRPVLTIAAVHLLLIIILVPARSAFDIEEIKQASSELAQETGAGQLLTLSVLVGAVVGSATGAVDQASGVYSSLLFLTISLAYIWALRHFWNRKSVTARDSFYKGMYPLVPFLLVLGVLSLQLLPAALTINIFATLRTGGLLGSGAEVALILTVVLLTILLSGYFISGTLMALYAVSLPDMRPLEAIRASRKLVEYRRWIVFRRLLQLIAALIVTGIVILLLTVQLIPWAAFWMISIGGVLVLPLAHGYLYTLYRKLL